MMQLLAVSISLRETAGRSFCQAYAASRSQAALRVDGLLCELFLHALLGPLQLIDLSGYPMHCTSSEQV
jgi:hypothetical protein